MKRKELMLILIILAGIVTVTLPLFPSHPLGDIMNWGLAATILAILVVLGAFFEFESAALGSREIALVAILGTISAVARIPFTALPSIQPCTYLIICSGFVFGPLSGFMVGAITALVSNFFLGQGPWTPYQMVAWGMAGLTAGFLGKLRVSSIWLVPFGILWGYLFGWITNTWFWASFVYPLTFKTFMTSQLGSLWFDTAHAIGNAILLTVFGGKTIGILERFRRRFNWKHVKSSPAQVPRHPSFKANLNQHRTGKQAALATQSVKWTIWQGD